jgi:hypothetical protein
VPITWRIDSTQDLAILTISAPYTFEDWRHAMDQALAAHPGPTHFLIDRRSAGVPTTGLVDEMIGYFRAHVDRLHGSTAAVVVGSDAAFGMARMLEIRMEVSRLAMPMKTFLDYEDAVRWLRGDVPTRN